jgi:hypothetical protein
LLPRDARGRARSSSVRAQHLRDGDCVCAGAVDFRSGLAWYVYQCGVLGIGAESDDRAYDYLGEEGMLLEGDGGLKVQC